MAVRVGSAYCKLQMHKLAVHSGSLNKVASAVAAAPGLNKVWRSRPLTVILQQVHQAADMQSNDAYSQRHVPV